VAGLAAAPATVTPSRQMPRRHRTHLASEHGQSVVEFALVGPIFIMLLLGVVQFGITLNHYLAVTDAARAGARTAAVDRLSGNAVADATAAIRKATVDLDQSKLGINIASPDWSQAGSDVTVTVTYPFQISILGLVVGSGNLTSTQTERLE